MFYYQDITLLNDEIGVTALRESTFRIIHSALYQLTVNHNGDNSVGVVFPDYNEEKVQLGNKIRLICFYHERLIDMEMNSRLKKYADYVHCTSIKPVPSQINGYVSYERYRQHKSLVSRLSRSVRKGWMTQKEMDDRIDQDRKKRVSKKLPFIRIKSSKGRQYSLLIAQSLHKKEVGDRQFSTYGLSSGEKPCGLPIF